MTFNSASVMAGVAFLPAMWRLSCFLSWLKKKLTGVKSRVNRSRGRQDDSSTFSGNSLAKLLGEISPKIKITTVVTIVATVTPLEPRSWMKTTVAMEAAAMLTILLPTRIVDRTESKSSNSFRHSLARSSPLRAMFLRRILLTLVRAVSADEKKAEQARRASRTAI